MASCTSCNSFILFGGEKVDSFRFCNKKCLEDGKVYVEASKVSDQDVDELANEIHSGACPICHNRKGVEVRKSYDIASFVFYSRYQTLKHICCRTCGLKKQSLSFIGSLFLGWWGIPWGILITPVQLVSNIVAMLFPPKTDKPSKDLKESARMIIAQHRTDSA